MNLTKKQRFEIIKKLTRRILNMGENEGFLFLEIYKDKKNTLFYKDYSNEEVHISFSDKSILSFIYSLDDATIYEMYKDQFPEEAEKEFSDKKPVYHLSTDKLILFFSHSHKNLNLVLSIKKILEKTDWIECFVAHKDIEWTEEWGKEIEKYLECCHCMLVFLSKKFKSSDYCDQEIGFAVQRGISIFPVKLDDTDPYGFIKHIQATPFNEKENPDKLAGQIEERILNKKDNLYDTVRPKLNRAVKTLTNNFLNSSNTLMAESVLDQLMGFKSSQIETHFINEIQEYWKKNNKIKEVKNIDKRMEEFFKKYPPKEISTKKGDSNKEPILNNTDETVLKHSTNER